MLPIQAVLHLSRAQWVLSPSHAPGTASAPQRVSPAVAVTAVWPSQSHHQCSALLDDSNGVEGHPHLRGPEGERQKEEMELNHDSVLTVGREMYGGHAATYLPSIEFKECEIGTA